MATSHMLEYSKSSRATCHGPPPCKGSSIELGTLRYGQVSYSNLGETVEWRHWGCVTPDLLGKLAATHLERVPGFNSLRSEDQAKVRLAAGLRRVDPSDVPASAKASAGGAGPIPSQQKRKAMFETAQLSRSVSSSQPRASQPQLLRNLVPTQREEEEVEEVPEQEESIDELYVVLKTKVVGLQYYKGLVGAGEEIRLERQPQNEYDRNAVRVMNIGGLQVGHIPRVIAAKLAPLMDSNVITVEGVMLDGNLTTFNYDLPLSLKIYGPADKRAQLEPRLIWATPGQRGFQKSKDNRPAPVPGALAPPRSVVQVPPPVSLYSQKVPYPYSQPAASPSYSQAVPYRAQATPYAFSQHVPPQPSAAQLAAQQEALRKQQEAQRKQQEALEKARELRDILDNLQKVDDEGRRSSLLDTLCDVGDVLALPEHPSPPGVVSGQLNVNLLKHQSQALKWCIDHEYPKLPTVVDGSPVQLWQLRKAGGKQFYFNMATKTPQEAAPALGRGALCADSMGLGKTLTMLSLILATKADISVQHSQSTLIVVPLSVLSNWEQQIQDHVKPGALTYCVYYGTTRSMSAEELKKYDIVITTYQTVTKDRSNAVGKADANGEPSKKKKKVQSSLFRVKWKRIILDEGHTIRNPRTQMAQAVYDLEAERRWILTGTPIINSPQDLGSILTFLRICRPLDNADFFKRLVLRPLKSDDPSGAELVKALMSQICIRRTKEMEDSKGNRLIPLPPVEITVVPVTLNPEARELYDAVEGISQQRVGRFIDEHGGISSAVVQSNILSMLTRLRQLALHPGLVPPDYLQQLRITSENEEAGTAPAIKLTAQDKVRLQGLLAQAIEDSEECPICFGTLTEPRITSCAHRFCLACISEVIARDPKCPMDRRAITLGDLLEPPAPTEFTQAPIRREEDEDLTGIRAGSSAKIDHLVHLLRLTPATDKSLVFSQFTGFLDKIAETLEDEGISYVRFDGSMSAKRRQETLAQFSVPVQDDSVESEPTQPAPEVPTGRRTRASSSHKNTTIVSDDVEGNGQDGDFIVIEDSDDNDDFIDDDQEERSVKSKSKGKGKALVPKSAASSDLTALKPSGSNPRVMLISLKAGALGLNLTVANNVYLMDPWWQEGIESQAIDRCNRIGQTKPVHVYQLIAQDTVEAKVIEIQERKKKLVDHAFSGIKAKETKREKKEARLQEVIALFGMQNRAGVATGANGNAHTSQATLDSFRN